MSLGDEMRRSVDCPLDDLSPYFLHVLFHSLLTVLNKFILAAGIIRECCLGQEHHVRTDDLAEFLDGRQGQVVGHH